MTNFAELSPMPPFMPQQFVRLNHLGCTVRGRVICLQLDRGGWSVEVEAFTDDDFKRRWFLPDELEACPS